jgi:hypothetical protein
MLGFFVSVDGELAGVIALGALHFAATVSATSMSAGLQHSHGGQQ